MRRYFCFIVIVLQFIFALPVFSQNEPVLKNIQVINGKKYYLHKVEKGQSLYGIAKLYNVDLNTLIVENPQAIDGIKAGQELKIPAEKSKEQTQPTLKDYEKYSTHKVTKGETVYGICAKYKITEQQLYQLNPDVKNGLKENTILKIREKETNKAVPQVPENTVVTEIPKDTTPVEMVNKSKKNAYNVGVFLPFHFDELDALNTDELMLNKQNFPPSQQLAVDFYEGLMQAADSLKSSDFSVVFKLFDSGERDSLSISRITQDTGFSKLDLIIGPLYNSPFKLISSQAKKYQIPCVSPLTQQNKVLFDNIYTSKTNPSNSTLIEGLAHYCADSLRYKKLILVSTGQAKDALLLKEFKEYFGQYSKDTLVEVSGWAGAKTAYIEDKTVYYIVLTETETFISNFLTQLNIFSDKKENIRVIGPRKWLYYDNLDLEYMNNFSFTCAVPYFIDEENTYVKKLNQSYTQKYAINPDDYYYMAADIGLYYFSMLKNIGPSFSVVLDEFEKKGVVLDFKFIHPNNHTGFENQSTQIIRYTDYSLKKVN